MMKGHKKNLHSIDILSRERAALPADLPSIIRAFTDRRRSPFTSQRFPARIEPGLHALLLSGLISPGCYLRIIEAPDEQPLAFVMTDESEPATHCLLLAGVWPEYRGQGIFKRIVERMISVRPDVNLTVRIETGMDIAARQLRKLGYQPHSLPIDRTSIIYSTHDRII